MILVICFISLSCKFSFSQVNKSVDFLYPHIINQTPLVMSIRYMKTKKRITAGYSPGEVFGKDYLRRNR